MAVRVRLNRAGVRELLLSAGVQGAVTDQAEDIASKARATAPVGETGEYQASIGVIEDPTPNRARARVVANDDKAAIVESRTRNLGSAIG